MLHALLVVASLAPAAAAASPPVEFIGAAAIAGDERDRSRLRNLLGGKHPHNRLGSFGSGIDFTGAEDVYLACADRGPADGAFDFACRVQRLRITIDPAAEADRRISAELLDTVLLRDEQGETLTGISSALDAAVPPQGWRRFDPEGIRLARGPVAQAAPGSFFICDEYGPWIVLFSADGRILRRLAVPNAFTIAAHDADPKRELPPRNRRGRQPNRGFEGLAISPDGRTLLACPQSPLIQDGALDAEHGRIGVNIRVLAIGTEPGAGTPRQFVYPLEHPRDGVSEVLALDDHRLLVLERDGRAGAEARRRAVFLADASDATDVSAIEALPSRDLPPGVRPMSKRRLIDLMDPSFDLLDPQRGGMPEKIEGLCFGPDLPDGRRTLIITTDNDLKPEHATWIWVFAVDVR